MRKQAWQQGHFDGFCGLYSLINAVDHLHHNFTEADCEKLFEHLIRASDPVDHVVLNGLDFEPLVEVAETVPEYLKEWSHLVLTTPFVHADVASTDQYWDELAGMLGENRVAIVGLGEPWDHWTVVTQITPRSIRFRDSYGIKRFPRSEFSLTEQEDRIALDFRETILVERQDLIRKG